MLQSGFDIRFSLQNMCLKMFLTDTYCEPFIYRFIANLKQIDGIHENKIMYFVSREFNSCSFLFFFFKVVLQLVGGSHCEVCTVIFIEY
jgi:hypothetical protein